MFHRIEAHRLVVAGFPGSFRVVGRVARNHRGITQCHAFNSFHIVASFCDCHESVTSADFGPSALCRLPRWFRRFDSPQHSQQRPKGRALLIANSLDCRSGVTHSLRTFALGSAHRLFALRWTAALGIFRMIVGHRTVVYYVSVTIITECGTEPPAERLSEGS
ncbi:hypothetical protein [Candidatus Accumulibacter phosphatis]|uniref:hypothetical protein n=1 Tax=Candidatus Accumulibacter phosphatis TaxID=327160 RepID=UPI00145D9AEE|nr:hypothetical protein [Candidatus Accumulibacter phosphatis]